MLVYHNRIVTSNSMPEAQGDSLPTQEIVEAYQSVKSSVEQGNYTSLICSPEEGKAIVDRLASELAQSHTTIRVTVSDKGRDFPGVLSDFESLAPEVAKGVVEEGLSTASNFYYLMEKTAQVNKKPVLTIIENLQHVTDARDDLIRTVRSLYNVRSDPKSGLRNISFLLVADQSPTALLREQGTPYNIGTNIYLRS